MYVLICCAFAFCVLFVIFFPGTIRMSKVVLFVFHPRKSQKTSACSMVVSARLKNHEILRPRKQDMV